MDSNPHRSIQFVFVGGGGGGGGGAENTIIAYIAEQDRDLRFYVLFNSKLVISGQWEGDNKRLCAVESRSWLNVFSPPMGVSDA